MEFQPPRTTSDASKQNVLPYARRRSPVSYDRGVQIAAARLRVVCDRRLGKETPDWLRELAAEKLAGEY